VSSTVDGKVESNSMNAMSDIETVNRFARRLEDVEAKRLGVRIVHARAVVASKLGISPGTLENWRRMRTKVVPNWLMNKVRTELISVLQSEIQRLEHEIHISRQIGSDYRDDDLASAETQLAAARQILKGEVK
jgi:hypothetical protein